MTSSSKLAWTCVLCALTGPMTSGCGDSAPSDTDAAVDAASPSDLGGSPDLSTPDSSVDDAATADAASDLGGDMDAEVLLDQGTDSEVVLDQGGPVMEISFQGVLGGQAVACGSEYTGFGPSEDQTVKIKDFRFYVHGVELIRDDAEVVPLVLLDEPPFQRDGVALLDFENKTGDCVNGTTATRSVVRGTAPAGNYVGLRFVLGVPLDQNHQDRSIASAPLDLTQLFWSWAGGYIFARFDLMAISGTGAGTTPATFSVHLGSTGCNGTPATMPSTTCMYPNRPVITLMDFDPATDVILVDPKPVVEGVDLTVNTTSTAIGCMSARNDPECTLVMPRLGVDFDAMTGAQVLFRVAE